MSESENPVEAPEVTVPESPVEVVSTPEPAKASSKKPKPPKKVAPKPEKKEEPAPEPTPPTESKKPVTKKSAPKKADPKPPAKKAAPKKPEAKKSVSKKVEKTPGAKSEHGLERSKDLPWTEKKVAIFKALKALKAYDPMTARSAKEVSAKTGGIADDMAVRHYCYHAKVSGLVGVHKMEGQRGYSFSLTKKGQSIDPAQELKNE